MEPKKEAVLESQIRRTRTQSYVFLGLFLLGIAAIIYTVTELQRTKEDLRVSNEALSSQEQKLQSLNDSLDTALEALSTFEAAADSSQQRASLEGQIRQKNEQFKLGQSLSGLNRMTLAELQEKYQQILQLAEGKIAKRKELSKQLFSQNESTRESARNALLREYKQDVNLVKGILEASKGHINWEERNSYYQAIYIFNQLDAPMLSPHKEGLEQFFREGAATKPNSVIGAGTQKSIDGIRRKMG